MMFLLRWGLVVVLFGGIALAALVGGCMKYVPVDIKLPDPKAPSECKMTVPRPKPLKPFPRDAEARKPICGESSLAVCVAQTMAKRDVEWQSYARRRDALDTVCRSFTSTFQ